MLSAMAAMMAVGNAIAISQPSAIHPPKLFPRHDDAMAHAYFAY
jgi:hypothetical protein